MVAGQLGDILINLNGEIMLKTYKVWDRDPAVEQRTFDRAAGNLPEMESAKQLRHLISQVYKPDQLILDVGCAAGHYLNSLESLDPNIKYTGIDATKKYIDFAKENFTNKKNVNFEVADIFKMNDRYSQSHDVVFCCNVLLHLPSVKIPIENLVNASRGYVFIRTLVSGNTHLSKFLYSDSFDEDGEPNDFVFQNTYSSKYLKNIIEGLNISEFELIEDSFDSAQINAEFSQYKERQSAVTEVLGNKQIAGSKVFEWAWIKIKK